MDKDVERVIREKIQQICEHDSLPRMGESFEFLDMRQPDIFDLVTHVEDELQVWLDDYDIDYDPKCTVREFIAFVTSKIIE